MSQPVTRAAFGDDVPRCVRSSTVSKVKPKSDQGQDTKHEHALISLHVGNIGSPLASEWISLAGIQNDNACRWACRAHLYRCLGRPEMFIRYNSERHHPSQVLITMTSGNFLVLLQESCPRDVTMLTCRHRQGRVASGHSTNVRVGMDMFFNTPCKVEYISGTPCGPDFDFWKCSFGPSHLS